MQRCTLYTVQYVFYFCLQTSGPETRHLPLYLFKLWQDLYIFRLRFRLFLGHCTLSFLGKCTLSILGQCTLAFLEQCTLAFLGLYTLTFLGQCTRAFSGQCTLAFLGKCTVSILDSVYLHWDSLHFHFWDSVDFHFWDSVHLHSLGYERCDLSDPRLSLWVSLVPGRAHKRAGGV